MPDFDEKTYILGFWFAEDNIGNNWMLRVQKNGDDWHGTFRFRYKKDDKIWDSDDEKIWNSFRLKNVDEKEVIQEINIFFTAVLLEYPRADTLLVQGGIEKFLELANTKSWMQIKKVKIKNDKE